MDKEPDIKLTEKDFEGQPLLGDSNLLKLSPCYQWESPCHQWEWNIFGGGELVVKLAQDTPVWRRIITRILLGSKWKRL
jgi:hypothetical protein